MSPLDSRTKTLKAGVFAPSGSTYGPVGTVSLPGDELSVESANQTDGGREIADETASVSRHKIDEETIPPGTRHVSPRDSGLPPAVEIQRRYANHRNPSVHHESR